MTRNKILPHIFSIFLFVFANHLISPSLSLSSINDELRNMTITLFNIIYSEGNWTGFNGTFWNDSDRPTFPPIVMTTTPAPRPIPLARMLYNDSSVDEGWRMRMVHNLRWDLSNNFLAVSYLNLESQTIQNRDGKDNYPVAVIGQHYYPLSRMSFFYGINYPNMLIRFNQTEAGAAFCEFGHVKESFLHKNQKQLDDWKWEHCRYKRQPIYEVEETYEKIKIFSGELLKNQLYAFCPIPLTENGSEPFEWRMANGKYNLPSKTPHCLYDFYEKAKMSEEYHLLKYCAKAYFFNGMDYHISDKRLKNRRKDWLLYLAEGQLRCSISGDVQTDMDLVAKGYSIELVQYSIPRRLEPWAIKCPVLKATLVSYKDEKREGKFFIAAVIGSAQLEGEFKWPYSSKIARFWDKETYFENYKYMNYDDKACYIFYQTFLRDIETKRYHLELKVSHFCTKRGMRGILKFNISIGPNQVQGDGIYEDTGIQIDLNEGKMRRSTGHILDALKNVKPHIQQSSTVPPIKLFPWISQEKPAAEIETPSNNDDNRDDEGIVPENGKCDTTYQCKYGFRCGNLQEQAYCDKLGDYIGLSLERDPPDEAAMPNCGAQENQRKNDQFNPFVAFTFDQTTRCVYPNNSPKREGSGPDKRGIGCTRDYQCRFDEFCAYSGGECRKNEFMLDGQKCYLNRECLPRAYCNSDKGVNKWGICKLQKTYNQNAEKPNDPLN